MHTKTAILAELGARVYSIERQKSLYMLAQKNLSRLEYHSPVLFYGDGFAGLPQFAPFKGILITCGAPEIPQTLLKQLAIGGKNGYSSRKRDPDNDCSGEG